jgi:hypothetical protein
VRAIRRQREAEYTTVGDGAWFEHGCVLRFDGKDGSGTGKEDGGGEGMECHGFTGEIFDLEKISWMNVGLAES